MIISKAQFARNRNVSKARVSQWLKAGQIFGPALVDGGIDEAIACGQLNVKLDIDQRLSGNGLATNLTPSPDAPLPLADPPAGNTVQDKIALERLELLQRQNREKATDEARALGLLCDTAQARQETGKVVAGVVARVEGSLTELASAISAQFKLPHRDVLHCLRGEWRKVRVAAAVEARERAEPLPETTGFELDDA